VIAKIGEEELQRAEIIINVRRPPIGVHLTVKPVRAKTGENVDFSADQEVRIEGTEFRFDFGDGEVSGWSTATTAKHAYAREKEYIASVKARLGDMAADSNFVIIQVMADDKQVMADYKVVIYAKAQRTRGGYEIFREGDEIVFGAVLAPEAHGASFKFDFGDNSPTDWALKPEVEHEYTSPGKYISHVTASIRGTTLRSGKLVINVEARRPSLLPLLLLLAPAAGYFLSRKIADIIKPKPSLQLKPGGDPGIQRVSSGTSLLSYSEIRLRSVLEPDRDRINIEVSLAVGEEVET
jgi:hypothetical protein